MKKIFPYLCMMLLFLNFQNLFSQNPLESIHDTINKDDLGDVKDEFQNHFFNALANRAIENYERAIEDLREAENFKVDPTAVYFEMGKNYASLENFMEAEKYFNKALQEKPEEADILSELVEVYKLNRDYSKAIKTAKKLKNNKEISADLAELYFLNKEYIKALETLDKVISEKENEEKTENLRKKIFAEAKKAEVEQYLKSRIKAEPENTLHFIKLILLYDGEGELSKAQKIGEELKKLDADEPVLHLPLYKAYLKENKNSKAVSSMKILMNAPDISAEIKQKVMVDFENLIKENPELSEEWVGGFEESLVQENQTDQQMGEFYLERDKAKALDYFEKALKENPNDYKTILQVLKLQIEEEEFSKAKELAEEKIFIFPTQAILYFYKGVAENKLDDFKEAQKSLMNGLDFVIDNPEMERNFYKELTKTFKGLGQNEKALEYEQKSKK